MTSEPLAAFASMAGFWRSSQRGRTHNRRRLRGSAATS
jgi:hypothetical protein